MNADVVASQTEDGVVIRVHVQPKSRQTGIVGLHDDRLRIAVAEPPDRGKANAAVIRLLSEALGLPRTEIRLLRGETSRRKDLLISGQTLSSVLHALQKALP